SERAPAPGPERRDLQLARDLPGGERLPLDDAQPRLGGLEPLAAGDARRQRGVEAEHEAELRSLDARALEQRAREPQRETHPPVRDHRAEWEDLRRVEVRLVHEARTLRGR